MTAMMSMSMSMSASASSRPRQVVVHQRGRGGAAGKIHVLGDRTQGSGSVSKKKTMADVPQPQPIYPLVGNLPQLKFDMLHIPLQVARLYNEMDCDTLKLQMFSSSSNTIRTRSLSGVLNVLKDNKHYNKLLETRESFNLGIFEEFLGRGLASIDDGPMYKELRSIMNPAFRKVTTDSMVKDFSLVGAKLLQSIEASGMNAGVVDMQSLAMAATVDSIGLLHFRTDLQQLDMLNGSDSEGPLKSVADIMTRITTEGQMLMLPGFISEDLPKLLPGYTKYRSGLDDLDTLIKYVIEQRKSLGLTDDDKDVLGAILAYYGKEGYEWLTFPLLRDQLTTLFFAGSDTTASTIAWTLYELSKNEDVQLKVQKEVDAMMKKPSIGGDPANITANDLDALEELFSAIKETLRLYPAAPIIGRDCIEENIMDGYLIEPGAIVITDIYSLHRNPKLWADPSRWYPERWSPLCDEPYKVKHPEAWVPFATGQRACIGKYFAIRESQFFLAMLLHNFNWAPGPSEPEIAHAITITAMNGINLKAEKRM
mmetsp:Transcript_2180/g.3363  ORF Transcript_2180/g.3363 Transcript_2180/m.3363 type:complete len:538 (+) Transcript_2180:237-1850(+)